MQDESLSSASASPGDVGASGFEAANQLGSVVTQSQSPQNAFEDLIEVNDIVIDSSVLEKVSPSLHTLMQIRAMLVLGSTSGSTNVNETRHEELEMLIDELVEVSGD